MSLAEIKKTIKDRMKENDALRYRVDEPVIKNDLWTRNQELTFILSLIELEEQKIKKRIEELQDALNRGTLMDEKRAQHKIDELRWVIGK